MTPDPVDPPAKRYHHGDLPLASVQVALELLKEGGVDKLSLREVARRLGVSATALYHHFPDKEALLAQVCREGMIQFRSLLLGAVDADPTTNLARMGQVYLGFFAEHPYYLDLLFLPKHKENPEIHEVWHGTMDLLRATLEAQGWSTEKAQSVGLWLWATVHGLATMLREGIIGCPETCTDDAPPIFRWTPEEVPRKLLPLATAILSGYPAKNT